MSSKTTDKAPKCSHPWSKLDDAPLVLLSPYEFFTGYKGETDPSNPLRVALRMVMVATLVFTFVVIAVNIMVVVMDQSALSHQCEQNYFYWWMAICNIVMYSCMLTAFYITWNPIWLRYIGVAVVFLTGIMLIWWAAAFVRMHHICVTFYSIKYPMLANVANLSAALNIMLFIGSCVYECCRTIADKDQNFVDDDILVTSMFFKYDETYIPALFNTPTITTYKTGIQSWSRSIEGRNKTLQHTLTATDKIHESSRSQSQLLTQVTNLVKETEEKTTKTAKLMDEQDALLGDLKLTIGDVRDKLNNMPMSVSDISMLDCTYTDAGKWCCMILMCCGGVIFALAATKKWCALLDVPCDLFL